MEETHLAKLKTVLRIRFILIRIRGNFNSVNLVFNCFVKFRIHINFTYYYIFRNLTKNKKKLVFKQKNENIGSKVFFHHVFTDNFDFFLHGFG